MPEQTDDDRLNVMEAGWCDHDDVEWLIDEYRKLRAQQTEQIAAVRQTLDILLVIEETDQQTSLPARSLNTALFKIFRDSGMYERMAELGIVPPFDDYHHAPRCPANHWCRQLMPGWNCTCGARAAGHRSESSPYYEKTRKPR